MIEPLVPPEVDLRDYPSTPIIRGRLFGSTFHSRANDGEWRAGVTLWCKSWDQVPAGTLPQDDVDLCRLAELGRDARAWKKLRTMALHGWALATDGLMYHRIVAEVVLVAWLDKLGKQLSGGAGNAKRWGFVFDAETIQGQIATASRMLFTLNPQSNALRKKRISGIPTGPPDDRGATPNGNAGATNNDPNGIADGTPDRIAREVNGIALPTMGLGGKPPKGEGSNGQGNGGDRNPLESQRQTAANQGWNRTDAGVLARGVELHKLPFAGESSEAYRERIIKADGEARR